MSASGPSGPLVNLGCVIEGHELASVFRDISENKISLYPLFRKKNRVY